MSYQGISFGDCSNCRHIKANWAQLSILGSGYRIDRTLISPNPLPADMDYKEQRLTEWVGWQERNMWTGVVTKSDPEFRDPTSILTWSPSQIISDDGVIRIIKTLGYSPTLLYFDVFLQEEKQTFALTQEEKEDKLRHDAVHTIPWENPLVYDLEHCMGAIWEYDENGNLTLTQTLEDNPFNYVFTGGCRSWSVYWTPNTSTITAIRFRKRKLLQHRLASTTTTVLPAYNRGLIYPPPGSVIDDEYIVAGGQIVLPPTTTQLLHAGWVGGQSGHTSTIVC